MFLLLSYRQKNRKKQEFSGAIANLKIVKCHDGKIEQQAGSFINQNTL